MNMKISIDEALLKLHELEGKKFAQLVTPDLINKGSAGQLLELALGLVLSSDLLDLSDGELKSNKFLKGRPAETMAITQVGHTLSEISANTPWEDSKVLRKINSFILVPVHKDEPNPADWVIGKATHFQRDKFPSQYEKLASDYLEIADQLRQILSSKDELHTLNAKNKYLQIRTKDSKDSNGAYHPIKCAGRDISSKNYAFYFRKQFLSDVLK